MGFILGEWLLLFPSILSKFKLGKWASRILICIGTKGLLWAIFFEGMAWIRQDLQWIKTGDGPNTRYRIAEHFRILEAGKIWWRSSRHLYLSGGFKDFLECSFQTLGKWSNVSCVYTWHNQPTRACICLRLFFTCFLLCTLANHHQTTMGYVFFFTFSKHLTCKSNF